MRYPEKSYYDSLGIPPNAHPEQIKRAYRQQMKFFHPDVFPGSPEIAESKSKELNEAYEVLSSFSKKHLYDSWLRETAYLKKQEQARAAERAQRAAQDAAQAYYDQWWHAYAAQQVAADEQAKKAQEAHEAELREAWKKKQNEHLQFWTKAQKVTIVALLSLCPVFAMVLLLLEHGIIREEWLGIFLLPHVLIALPGAYITEFFIKHYEKRLQKQQ